MAAHANTGHDDKSALPEQIAKTSTGDVVRDATAQDSLSDVATQLRQIWAAVLSMDAASIGLDDNFFELGGDSIDAMRVVSKARKLGLPKFKVVELYSHPILRDTASQICTSIEQLDPKPAAATIADARTERVTDSRKEGKTQEPNDQDNLPGTVGEQVSTSGRDVNLDEIKAALSRHRYVKEVHVTAQSGPGQAAARITGFVTLNENEVEALNEVREEQESNQVELWRGIYDDEAYSSIGQVQADTVGKDFIGWNSMFDGKPIDKAEMEEWLQDTISTILNGKPPGRFLEIGSGSGMVLFNLGSGIKSYIGLEPSERAVQFITNAAKSIPELAGKVEMYRASADDIPRIKQPLSAETVIINSVAQYFPSRDYVLRVIKSLAKLDGVKRIFFGDVRSYAQYRDFLAARALHMLGAEATPKEVRAVMAQLESSETELLLDPAFFTGLQGQLDGCISHVEILPKAMHASNELSRYRYAAVLHVRQRSEDLQVQHVEPSQWVDFEKEGFDRAALLQYLQNAPSSSAVAVGNIPHSQTIYDRSIVDALDDTEQQLDPTTWLSSIREAAQARPALSVMDLKSLAQEAGYRVEVSWNRQFSQRGALDAIFHRTRTDSDGERTLFRFPTEHEGRLESQLSTEPLRQQFRRTMQQKIYEDMVGQLPEHMAPERIVIVDKIPATLESVMPSGQ